MRISERVYEVATELSELKPKDLRWVAERMTQRDLSLVGEAARTDWETLARPKQIPPGGLWRWLVFCCGRSWGKSRACAEAFRAAVESGEHAWLTICAPTATTLWRDCVGGPSGLLAVSPKWYAPVVNFQRAVALYPRHPVTGRTPRVSLLSADRPDRIRGNEASFMWLDEPEAWTRGLESFTNLDIGLRHSSRPHGVISMTPKMNALTMDLLIGPKVDGGLRKQSPDVRIVNGPIEENAVLDSATVASLRARYSGAMGRQELDGVLLQAPEGALFRQEVLEQFRVAGIPLDVHIRRTIVSVDPTRSPIGAGDACGILVGGLGSDGHVYVYKDVTLNGPPHVWARRAAEVAKEMGAAAICYEQNRIDPAIGEVLRQVAAASATHWEPITAVGTKRSRAEPVSLLVDEGRVHLVGHDFEALELELTTWDPTSKDSPDRLDAFVHLVSQLGTDPNKRVKAPLAYA